MIYYKNTISSSAPRIRAKQVNEGPAVPTQPLTVFTEGDGVTPIGENAVEVMKESVFKVPKLSTIEGFNGKVLTDEMRQQAYTELNRNIASQAYPYRVSNRTLWVEGQDIADSVEHYKATSTKYCLLTGQNIVGGEGTHEKVKFQPQLFYHCSTNAKYCYERLQLKTI